MNKDPQRIPIAERLAQLNQQCAGISESNDARGDGADSGDGGGIPPQPPPPPPPGFPLGEGASTDLPPQPEPIDSTSTMALSDFINRVNALDNDVLTVTQAGRLQAVPAASVDINALTFANAAELDLDTALSHHLLVVNPDVDPRELEALAMSIWTDAAWDQPGHLRLTAGAHLSGPWRISKAHRAQLGTPVGMTQAWVVTAPKVRTNPAPQFLVKSDPVAAAFPQGMPAGLEYEVINALVRIARRLAGVIRVEPEGKLIQPDADAAVTMTVYASRWVDEDDLAGLLRPYLPDVVNSQQVDRLPAIDSPQRVQTREELAKAIDIPADELEQIAKVVRVADAKALSEEFTVSGYSLVASAGNTSRIHITVAPAQHIPTALRYQRWPEGAAVEFSVSWIPPQVYLEKLGHPGRAVRLERIRVKDQIEHLATLIARSTGGHVLDEDQFLVALR